MRATGKRITLVAVYLIYFWVLTVVYYWFVPDTFLFWQYSTENLEPLRLFIASVLVGSTAFLMPTQNTLSTFLLHLQFCLPVIPMLVIFACGQWDFFQVFIALTGFLTLLAVVRTRITPPLITLPVVEMGWAVGLLFLIAVAIAVILMRLTWSHFNLDLARVYEVRRLTEQHIPPTLKYLLFGITPVALSAVVGYGVARSRWWIVAPALMIFPLLFAFTSHRQFLLTPALIAFLFVGLMIRPYFLSVPLLLFFALLLAFLSDILISDIWVRAMLLDRLFFVPAQANFMHYEFFSTHPHLFWCDSPWLAPVTPLLYPSCPYSSGDVWQTVGRHFLGGDTRLNSAWLGTGYSHAGTAGIILYGFIVGLLLNYLDNLSKAMGRLFTGVSFSPLIVGLLLSLDLKTVFLTGGLLFYLLITAVIKTEPSTSHRPPRDSLTSKP